MLHTKVHGNRSTGSKEDCKAFYQFVGKDAICAYDQYYINNFIFLYLTAYIQNLVKKGQVVSVKNKF